jgi:peptide/nickel transport system permease protein
VIRYVVRRLLIAIPLLLVMSFLTFLLIQLTPGNFFDGLKMDPSISPETIQRYEDMYHLNEPVLTQYREWLKNVLKFDFGYSFYFNIPVARVLAGRLWNTFILSLASFLFTWMVAIPLGIYAAVHRNKLSDRMIQLGAFMSLSTPGFFLAMILLFFASQFGGLPLGGMSSANHDLLSPFGKIVDIARHLVIPVFVLSFASIGALQRITRGSFLEVLRQQYILTARAKGLSEGRVLYKHALRNAMNPLVTLFGYELSSLLSGAALIEIICNWPGLGSLMLTAVRSKDVYLVMSSMLMGGVLLLIGNLVSDVLLAWSDPRIRYD